jgi:hypothetical protein
VHGFDPSDAHRINHLRRDYSFDIFAGRRRPQTNEPYAPVADLADRRKSEHGSNAMGQSEMNIESLRLVLFNELEQQQTDYDASEPDETDLYMLSFNGWIDLDKLAREIIDAIADNDG